MSAEALQFVIQKTRELIDAPTCSKETKAAAQSWLDAVGTDKEASETEAYIRELEADIMPLDNLIAFSESDDGARLFGADKAKQVAAHAKELKTAGETYCDCPACAIGAEILEKKDSLL